MLPATALAECPPETSVDRYTQTARDALSALDGLVPESQQEALEDRYAAMLVMRWNWQGGDVIEEDPEAVAFIANCIANGRCEASTPDMVQRDATELPTAPSPVLLYWAQTELECEATPPDELLLADADIEDEGLEDAPSEETEEVETAEIDDVPETDQPEVSETELAESTETPEPVLVQAQVAPVSLTTVQTEPTVAMVETTAATNMLFQTALTLVATGRPTEAIEPLRSACFAEVEARTNARSCDTLLDIYDAPIARRSWAHQLPDYLTLSEELCSMDYLRGCQNLARHYAEQDTVETLMAEIAYTERACGLGDGEACATASGYYLTGLATDPNPKLAREMLERSCRLQHFSACQTVADFYLRGVGGKVNVERALQVNEDSCPADGAAQPDMCVAAADFVLIHMDSGPERSALVRVFTERACAIGHDVGCAWYAEDLELGLGGEIDLAAAEQARLTACEYGHTESCNTSS